MKYGQDVIIQKWTDVQFLHLEIGHRRSQVQQQIRGRLLLLKHTLMINTTASVICQQKTTSLQAEITDLKAKVYTLENELKLLQIQKPKMPIEHIKDSEAKVHILHTKVYVIKHEVQFKVLFWHRRSFSTR